MIFTPEHIQMIINGKKTQTRRVVKEGDKQVTMSGETWVNHNGRVKWWQGSQYSIQPGRAQKGVGYIRIVSIGADWLQCISHSDSEREGYPVQRRAGESYHEELGDFIAAWNSINTRKGTRWDDNPLVWVITFEFVK